MLFAQGKKTFDGRDIHVVRGVALGERRDGAHSEDVASLENLIALPRPLGLRRERQVHPLPRLVIFFSRRYASLKIAQVAIVAH